MFIKKAYVLPILVKYRSLVIILNITWSSILLHRSVVHEMLIGTGGSKNLHVLALNSS